MALGAAIAGAVGGITEPVIDIIDSKNRRKHEKDVLKKKMQGELDILEQKTKLAKARAEQGVSPKTLWYAGGAIALVILIVIIFA
jgi:hypothetical protein